MYTITNGYDDIAEHVETRATLEEAIAYAKDSNDLDDEATDDLRAGDHYWAERDQFGGVYWISIEEVP